MDSHLVVTGGAIYGVVQAIANLGTLVFPDHTIAFKVCKWLISGFGSIKSER